MHHPSTKPSVKERLLEAGTILFATRGFEGASVRDICDLADTSNNMIHHYFNNKQGLFDTLVSSVSEKIFAVPVRMIQISPTSAEEFVSRLELFVAETLHAMLEHRLLFTMAMREEIILRSDIFDNYNNSFIRFLEDGKKKGFVDQGVNSGMLTGFIIDRVGNQVQHADWIRQTSGMDIRDNNYQNTWLKANLHVLIHGLLSKQG